MAMYSAQSAKRQKTSAATTLRDVSSRANVQENSDYFPGLGKVEFRPDSGVEEALVYRYYNATERVHGRTMEEWIRPAVSFWQAFHSTTNQSQGTNWNEPNLPRSWEESSQTTDGYKRRLKAAFEFYTKIGVKYWTVWDRDLAPEGETIDETNHNLDESVEYVIELQSRTGIKPLWVATNLHYSGRYSNGALTSSEAQVVSYAGAQIKKALEVAHKLGAENFLFRGIKEGYNSTLNTDHSRQLRNYARLLKMAADYKDRLGYRGQLLFEPNVEDFYTQSVNVRESDTQRRALHQYDYDTPSAVCFLKHYGLDRLYKISSKPGHQLVLASVYGMLGSVDSTFITSPPSLTDNTQLLKAVIENGGLQPGGINIGVKLRPDSSELKDLAVAYVSTIDTLGKALRIASKIISDGVFVKNLQQRYLSFHSGFGSRFVNGEASLEECEEQSRKQNGDMSVSSGRSEQWEAVFQRYVDSKN